MQLNFSPKFWALQEARYNISNNASINTSGYELRIHESLRHILNSNLIFCLGLCSENKACITKALDARYSMSACSLLDPRQSHARYELEEGTLPLGGTVVFRELWIVDQWNCFYSWVEIIWHSMVIVVVIQQGLFVFCRTPREMRSKLYSLCFWRLQVASTSRYWMVNCDGNRTEWSPIQSVKTYEWLQHHRSLNC